MDSADYWDAVEMTHAPNVWTGGSGEDFYSVGGFEVAGAGVYLPAPEIAFEVLSGERRRYGDASVAVLLCLSLDPCRPAQRAEFLGAIIALQSYWPCHLGFDNLNVASSIGRLLDRGCLAKPLPYCPVHDPGAGAGYG